MPSSPKKAYTIAEFDKFVRGGPALEGYTPLPEHTFDQLAEFVLANNSSGNTQAVELLSFSARGGIGKIIAARNYVGVITMKDGTVIEILPKIHGGGKDPRLVKDTFLKMLRTVKDVAFKDFNDANLKTGRLNLFEIFISLFVAQIDILVKQGLKSAYNPVEANEIFFKGKLNVPQNLKHNYVRRERFFVGYDEWSLDRPENRLLKSGLLFVQKQTRDDHNWLSIRRLLSAFDGLKISENYEADFSKCVSDRNLSHYAKALSWCKVFLYGSSFTTFAGSEVALALLFPMEKIFESFVSAKLRRYKPDHIELKIQDSQYSLFERPTEAFGIRPDLVLLNDKETIVMDTKWKLLSGNLNNHYGISNQDMFQMYAYGKKYAAKKVVLLYPKSDNQPDLDISYHSKDGVIVEVFFIDLLQPDLSVTSLFQKNYPKSPNN